MEKKRTGIMLMAFAAALALAVPISYSVGANTQAGGGAGSSADPLVTASYVGQAVSYELVVLRQNQILRAVSGTVEIIVRPGSRARVVSQHTSTGLANLSTGREILSGDVVPENHLVLIPRADGRGLIALSETAYILVRGDYEIE